MRPQHRQSSPWRRLWLAMLLACLGAASATAQTAFSEYQVKAAVLFRFPEFVDWPAGAFADAAAPIVIGVLGDDPFGNILEQTVRSDTVKGRKVVIRRSRRVEELRHCHVLFISRSERNRLPRILANLAGAPVLTVGDTEQFASGGGAISLAIRDKNVHFEINVEAAKRAGLKISSKLLKLATVVGAGEGGS